MKHLLFLYVGLPVGGIETFLVRAAEGLSRRRVKVSVLLATRRGSAELMDRLKAAAAVAHLDDFLPSAARRLPEVPLLRLSMPIDGSRLAAWLGSVPGACHVADTGSLLMALRLGSVANIGSLTVGVYHDREYLFEDPLTAALGWDASRTLRNTPAPNFVFFNEQSLRAHAQRFELDEPRLQVCPIGVDLARFSNPALGGLSDRVVSIGRLTPFKTYNLVMLDVLARARDAGTPLRWEVWGEGELSPIMQSRIDQLNLGKLVTLKGNLRYEDMEAALSGCLAFVGSGTALVEASAAGVPAIAAIEHERSELTYGCLHDFHGLSYHDAGLPLPTTTFTSRLRRLRSCSVVEHAHECYLARQRAKDFSLDLTLDRFELLPLQVHSYRPSAPASRAAMWLAATAATKALALAGRRSQFLRRHSGIL